MWSRKVHFKWGTFPDWIITWLHANAAESFLSAAIWYPGQITSTATSRRVHRDDEAFWSERGLIVSHSSLRRILNVLRDSHTRFV